MTATPTSISAADLRAELVGRYPAPEWHVEPEVTLAGRRLDVVAFNLWGARRYRTVGFEIKISRGDWLRELADFQKAEEWLAVVDQFFIVAPGGLVKTEELPKGWGLLELRGSRMFTRATPPASIRDTLPREVAARFFTRLREKLEGATREAERQDRAVSMTARSEIRAEIRREFLDGNAHETRSMVEKANRYDALMADLGLTGAWEPDERVRKAVRFLARGGAEDHARVARNLLQRAGEESAKASAEIRGLIEALWDERPVGAASDLPGDR